MLEREVKLGRDTSILKVESGLGASGIPHVGSLGDAVRAYGVKLALQDLGYKSELIAYSDDMGMGCARYQRDFQSHSLSTWQSQSLLYQMWMGATILTGSI